MVLADEIITEVVCVTREKCVILTGLEVKKNNNNNNYTWNISQ